LFLLAALPGLQAAVELVESGGGLQPPGGAVSLLCKASGFTFGEAPMGWARQGPGKGLEWAAGSGQEVGSAPWCSASLRGRCSLSRDDLQASLRLRLSGLQEADSGTYYCAKGAAGGGTARRCQAGGWH
ncbi:HV307 protein, partial [Eubucco bourcierii]|nr:HV307 protein [Eubucco bourcierii]